MPSRFQAPSKAISTILRLRRTTQPSRQYATVATTITNPQLEHTIPASPQIRRHPATQPPTFKQPQLRKTQLLRQYASLLHSTPLTLIFQHNNIKAVEWAGLRRQLHKALEKVDKTNAAAGVPYEDIASGSKLQIIQTGIFVAALRVVEFYKPAGEGVQLEHVLSKTAHEAVKSRFKKPALSPLLSGPLVVLTFPKVSPAHLKAALSVLSPSPPHFPAPTRRANPGWHELAVQNGLAKLMFMGARVEGKVFDVEGAKWVAGIDGGLDGLRAQLVHLLQGVGAGVTNTLESAAKNLYITVESRRTMLEEEEKPKDEAKPE